MECNLVFLEVNLSLLMNLYSPTVYPELRRDHLITECRHNQRKTMTNLHSELSVKCTWTTAKKVPDRYSSDKWPLWRSATLLIDHSRIYLLKKGRGSLGNVALLIDESMLINNVHLGEFSFRNKRVTLCQVFFFRHIIST